MAFPRETEDQIRRTVLNICQDHIRKVLESVRELTRMMDDFLNDADADTIENHLYDIKKLKDEATEHAHSHERFKR